MACIDETCRNIVAVGARPHAFTDCLNFGNPEIPERLGVFREAVRGLGEICKSLGLPIPSGNVSLYNEAPGGHHILPTPMILGTGLIDDVRKAVSADFKEEGDRIYIVGSTKDEMGASLLFRKFGGIEGDVPGVDIDNLKKLMDKMLSAMDKGLVRACHDCSDGGMAVAVAEMCISGDIGAELDLRDMGPLDDARKLYSESNTRWIAEVKEKDAKAFQDIMGADAVCIGRTGGDSLKVASAGISLSVKDMRKAWNDPVWNIMGGVQ
jgi:phosphoribosylformylglycinamidine synthase